MDLSLVLSREELELVRIYFHFRPERILKRWGEVILAAATRAFQEQRFGATVWPERYPNQKAGKLNVAGAVEDLRTGSQIKKRRYDPRPAGVDSGALRQSLARGRSGAARAAGFLLEVGSDRPYATRFHSGGPSTQIITREVRQNLAKLLKRLKRKGEGRYEKMRLGFLFRVGELTTNSPPRPFVGITDQVRESMGDTLKRDIQAFLRSGGGDE